MKRLLLPLLLVPTTALADFDCQFQQTCTPEGCTPYEGGPMAVRQAGETYLVIVGDDTRVGYETTTDGPEGLFSLVIPPGDDAFSALLTILPSGSAGMSVHGGADIDVQIFTLTGLCAGDGG